MEEYIIGPTGNIDQLSVFTVKVPVFAEAVRLLQVTLERLMLNCAGFREGKRKTKVRISILKTIGTSGFISRYSGISLIKLFYLFR